MSLIVAPTRPLVVCLSVLGLLLAVGQVKAEMTGPLVITEVGPGLPADFVEVQNVSADVVDTSGWGVVINDSLSGDINSVVDELAALPSSMAVDEIFWRHDLPEQDPPHPIFDVEHYGWEAGGIPWRTLGPGWAMIVDDAWQVADFFIWGYTEDEMALLDLNLGEVNHVTIDDLWSGEAASIPPAGFDSFSHRRIGNADHDDVSDWDWNTDLTPGTTNPGLETPFVPEPSTTLLLVTAALGLTAYGWRKRRRG